MPLVCQAALTLEPGDTTIAKQLQMLQKRQRKARGDCSELIDQNDVVGLKKDLDTTYFYDIRGRGWRRCNLWEGHGFFEE